MQITGTQFAYYLICHRKLWLFGRGVTLEQDSDLVSMGKLIHETTYQSRTDRFKELAIDGIKLDYYDRKTKVIHEVKKSDSFSDAHVWQVKYYIYVLERNGIAGVTGLLEYPKLHKTEHVDLAEADRVKIPLLLSEIERITGSETAPDRLKVSKCRNCSYFDFCWIGEEEI